MSRRMMAWGGMAALLALSGCEALYMATGTEPVPALYKLPVKSRVLVMVDPRPSAALPVAAAGQMADGIATNLYEFKVAESFVAQARLNDLKHDPRFGQMSIADIARLVEADIVIYVDVLHFDTQILSDGQLVQGYGQVLVKVIDKDGKRLWPAETEALGMPVESRVDPTLVDTLNVPAAQRKMIDDMAIHVGQMFHEYQQETKGR